MPNALVSIIVPIYKVEEYLERCLDSIIAQRYRPIEVILVNDGSPDGCGDIIKRYEARYPIFRSIWQENQGVGAARNAGINMATGKYLTLLDSDDFVEPDFISRMVKIIEKKNADIVICNFYVDFSNGYRIPFPLMTLHKSMSGDEAAQVSLDLLRLPVFVWNKLYRRDLFTKYEISFPSIYYEDVATTARVLEQAKRVAITHKPIYHYCLRHSGITGSFHVKNIEDYLKAVDIIRHFIWNENLWDAWNKPYRDFLRKTEILLSFETLYRKQLSTKVRKHQLIKEIHTRIKELESPPSM